jgi:uncharacterized membrane protein YcaP (DUF421 family)
VDKGEPLEMRMWKANIDLGDILKPARMTHSSKTVEQINYAVLEKDGSISMVSNRYFVVT